MSLMYCSFITLENKICWSWSTGLPFLHNNIIETCDHVSHDSILLMWEALKSKYPRWRHEYRRHLESKRLEAQNCFASFFWVLYVFLFLQFCYTPCYNDSKDYFKEVIINWWPTGRIWPTETSNLAHDWTPKKIYQVITSEKILIFPAPPGVCPEKPWSSNKYSWCPLVIWICDRSKVMCCWRRIQSATFS